MRSRSILRTLTAVPVVGVVADRHGIDPDSVREGSGKMKHTATALLLLAVAVGIGMPATFAADPEAVDLIQYLSSPFVEEVPPKAEPDITPELADACGCWGNWGRCRPHRRLEAGAMLLHRSSPPELLQDA